MRKLCITVVEKRNNEIILSFEDMRWMKVWQCKGVKAWVGSDKIAGMRDGVC